MEIVGWGTHGKRSRGLEKVISVGDVMLSVYIVLFPGVPGVCPDRGGCNIGQPCYPTTRMCTTRGSNPCLRLWMTKERRPFICAARVLTHDIRGTNAYLAGAVDATLVISPYGGCKAVNHRGAE